MMIASYFFNKAHKRESRFSNLDFPILKKSHEIYLQEISSDLRPERFLCLLI